MKKDDPFDAPAADGDMRFSKMEDNHDGDMEAGIIFPTLQDEEEEEDYANDKNDLHDADGDEEEDLQHANGDVLLDAAYEEPVGNNPFASGVGNNPFARMDSEELDFGEAQNGDPQLDFGDEEF